MSHHLLKLGALALALGGLAAAGQAYAFSPLASDRASPAVIPVVDEQQQVDEHLNADQMPTNPPQPATAERKGEGQSGNGGGDVEIKELQNMFPSTPWPKNE
ncbi:hypothetical protein [Methyloceanibacter sp.]|uniref:hypothetical protein n=1 Tax=Methyloceanibacter sp. TaxID=1965321 RepID=UPI002D630BC9|nr:hypothetical protein [Methyloceanibacter sp.]HZP09057.1 hypothetical protein [Methyloceanibacter sp.]